MKVSLREIADAPTTIEFEIPAERFPVLREMALRGEASFAGPIASRLRLQRVSELIEVEGSVACTVRLSCARCLTVFDFPIAAEIRLAYGRRPPAAEAAEESEDVDPEEADLLPFSGEEIDLATGMQEEIVLALPIRALCREDCRGLCPHCGADLNRGPCACPRQEKAGPFAALRHRKIGAP
ncbi:MAG: DUF177 domain-containing protein [Desulfobacterales bacterium]